MKFPFARLALVLAASLTLASCGGGGKATFPITVTVRNLQNLQDGPLILSTNGMDLTFTAANPVADITQSFPNQIEYGQTYDVVPKGQVISSSGAVTAGAQPEHQTCSPSTAYPYNFLPSGTAGQLAKIQIYYDCTPISYALTGTITGLTANGLTLSNGSSGPVAVASGATTFTVGGVTFNQSYGVAIQTQPTGETCKISGGNGANNDGTGVMDEAATKVGGVNNLVITCVANSSP